LFEKGVLLEQDLNRYDTFHVTTGHARMSVDAWLDIYSRMAWIFWRCHRIRRRAEKEPDGASYRDIATTPVTPEDLELLELYHATPAAETAAIKVQRKRKAIARAAAFAN
jgi:hypothetical protein